MESGRRQRDKQPERTRSLNACTEIDDSPQHEDHRLKVGVQAQGGWRLQGAHCGSELEPSAGHCLRRRCQSSMQVTGHPHGTCHRGGPELGGSPVKEMFM